MTSPLFEFNKQNAFTKIVSKQIGKGVYSSTWFEVGDIVLYFHGPILQSEHVDNFDLGLQVGQNQFMMSAGDIDDYVNHSCNPSTVLVHKNTPYGNQWCLVAIKPIKPNDQLTFDYSVTMSGRYWTMVCKCGESNCRGIVEDLDQLNKEQQQTIQKYTTQYQ